MLRQNIFIYTRRLVKLSPVHEPFGLGQASLNTGGQLPDFAAQLVPRRRIAVFVTLRQPEILVRLGSLPQSPTSFRQTEPGGSVRRVGLAGPAVEIFRGGEIPLGEFNPPERIKSLGRGGIPGDDRLE